MKKLFFISMLSFYYTVAMAQHATAKSKVVVALENGQNVIVFPGITSPNNFFYLPANLGLSYSSTDIPEFLLIIYSDKSSVIKGGLLHFLFNWGLTKAQIKMVENRLKPLKLGGALHVEQSSSKPSFDFTGNPQVVIDILKRSMSSTIPFPTMPYDKSAIAFKFSAEDAKTIKTFLDDPQTLKALQIELKFDYYAMDKGVSTKYTHVLHASLGSWFAEALKFTECYKK